MYEWQKHYIPPMAMHQNGALYNIVSARSYQCRIAARFVLR